MHLIAAVRISRVCESLHNLWVYIDNHVNTRQQLRKTQKKQLNRTSSHFQIIKDARKWSVSKCNIHRGTINHFKE